jgi:gliding motility-associated lipoprotein GldH
MMLRTHHIGFLICLLIFSSCDQQRVYEKNADFKANEWNSTDTLRFEVDILDTDEKNVYVNIRHQFAFTWRNVWLNLSIQFPNDSIYTTTLNMPLSQPDGQWYGDCTGDVCLVQLPLKSMTNFSFPTTGTYVFSLNHEMREDPLKATLSAGIRIENSLNQE